MFCGFWRKIGIGMGEVKKKNEMRVAGKGEHSCYGSGGIFGFCSTLPTVQSELQPNVHSFCFYHLKLFTTRELSLPPVSPSTVLLHLVPSFFLLLLLNHPLIKLVPITAVRIIPSKTPKLVSVPRSREHNKTLIDSYHNTTQSANKHFKLESQLRLPP